MRIPDGKMGGFTNLPETESYGIFFSAWVIDTGLCLVMSK